MNLWRYSGRVLVQINSFSQANGRAHNHGGNKGTNPETSKTKKKILKKKHKKRHKSHTWVESKKRGINKEAFTAIPQGRSKHNTKNGGKWKWRNMEKTKNIKIKPNIWIWVSPESGIGERSWPTRAWRWADQHFLELTCWSLFLYFPMLWVWEKEKGKWDEGRNG